MIKHKIKIKDNGDYVYLCNEAVTPTMIKTSFIWKNVTCKNCLKQKIKKNL